MDMPEGADPFFRQFFGDNGGRQFNTPHQRNEKALGSGVIISPQGYILLERPGVAAIGDERYAFGLAFGERVETDRFDPLSSEPTALCRCDKKMNAGCGERTSAQGTADLKGKNLELAVGYSHPVPIPAPEGIEFEVPQPTRVVVKGISKQLVGETAAIIRKQRPPEPYKGKGIRYEGEYVARKVGKRA